ncbi:hypothetical protein [Corallococcus sp. Z5C101001]|uniref:hypothetical protein n=1 Tax=Corallococcus sp. Z5C101001 TaxID=2596829 RepID=UPI00117FF6B3|nr:hypothetical protein [Corallococcus sp. Z5C101001]TSC26034.1 hypothetical protein FOF48_23895 [Corallococcus sp. Z5C101001]
MRTRLAASAAASVLFLLACATPAMTVLTSSGQREEEMWGAVLLLMGWLGAFTFQLGWYANPLLVLTLILLLMGKDRGAIWTGVAASLLGLSSLSWYFNPVPANEGGGQDLNLLYPSIGFYLWMFSLLLGPITAYELSQRDAATRAAVAPPTAA